MIAPSARKSRPVAIGRALIIPVIACAFVIALFYQEHSFRLAKRTVWTSTPATVHDTRYRKLARFSFQYGGNDLYVATVLAEFTVDGTTQQEWVPLDEPPQGLDKLQTRLNAIRGKQCTVRWNPRTPDQKLAEAN